MLRKSLLVGLGFLGLVLAGATVGAKPAAAGGCGPWNNWCQPSCGPWNGWCTFFITPGYGGGGWGYGGGKRYWGGGGHKPYAYQRNRWNNDWNGHKQWKGHKGGKKNYQAYRNNNWRNYR